MIYMMKNSKIQEEVFESDDLIILEICLKLKDERIYSKIDLDTVAKKTKISRSYLEIIESGELDNLPFADIYTKFFIKKYANYLEVKIPPELDSIFTKKYSEPTTYNQKEMPYSSHNLPRILRIVLVLMVILIFFGYLGFQVQNILKPPTLILYSPENGKITQEYTTEIHGKTNPEISVFINGKIVKTSETGEFTETINLNKGLNTIVISAKKKYGKTITDTRYVILKENQEFSYTE
ncbi:MAG: hypothetical protein CO137_00755 [Candidatus Magasanikbacteria bacterium CG_4_9_14_3_um_filter_32_9]|uniref:HTH cro/C1-type domain-containing protein n=1 Tax=Candidatus Magasanikbacteria bacterium CG_4_9_14_3_um_filter_32_9 TaxID=1974644 RepID=A0A2M7Z7H5_9BACT|nr:MAG: hypothetical protein CO137_00755 [Candidatus Magasanikbacteria bacterium CG_4_9_14_3_um_filter_32_9]